MWSGGVIWGVGMLCVALSPTATLALLSCALAAVGGPLTDVMRAFLIQTEFPPDQIGKVYSLRVTASKASHGVGLLLAAPLFAWADVSAVRMIAVRDDPYIAADHSRKTGRGSQSCAA